MVGFWLKCGTERANRAASPPRTKEEARLANCDVVRPLRCVAGGRESYTASLSDRDGAAYRLPSEAEWEYAAQTGKATGYGRGDEIGVNLASCYGNYCRDQ